MSARIEYSIGLSALGEAIDEAFTTSCGHIFHRRNDDCPVSLTHDVCTLIDDQPIVDPVVVDDLVTEVLRLREVQEEHEFTRESQVRAVVDDERHIRSFSEEAPDVNQELRQQQSEAARLVEERERLRTENQRLQLRFSTLMQFSENIRATYRYLHPTPSQTTLATDKLSVRGFEEAAVSDPQQAIIRLMHHLDLQPESSRFLIIACVELRANPGQYQITIRCVDTSLKLELMARFQSPVPEMRQAIKDLKIVDSIQVKKFYKYVNTQLIRKRGIARLSLSNDQVLIQLAGAEAVVELQTEEDVCRILETLDQMPATSKRRRTKPHKKIHSQSNENLMLSTEAKI